MAPTQLFPQESVILAFKRLFPYEWFAGFRFPWVEDLVNDFPFISYPTWRAQRGLEWDGPLGPLGVTQHSRLLQRHAEGQQAGALSHKAALPPLLSFGLSIDDHFTQSLTLGHHPLPTERPPLLDDDLWFCAEQHWRPPAELYASYRCHQGVEATVDPSDRSTEAPSNSSHSPSDGE